MEGTGDIIRAETAIIRQSSASKRFTENCMCCCQPSRGTLVKGWYEEIDAIASESPVRVQNPYYRRNYGVCARRASRRLFDSDGFGVLIVCTPQGVSMRNMAGNVRYALRHFR